MQLLRIAKRFSNVYLLMRLSGHESTDILLSEGQWRLIFITGRLLQKIGAWLWAYWSTLIFFFAKTQHSILDTDLWFIGYPMSRWHPRDEKCEGRPGDVLGTSQYPPWEYMPDVPQTTYRTFNIPIKDVQMLRL